MRHFLIGSYSGVCLWVMRVHPGKRILLDKAHHLHMQYTMVFLPYQAMDRKVLKEGRSGSQALKQRQQHHSPLG
jgi:hypothetical protein